MAIITDKTFNTLVWHPIDPKIIGGVIAGLEVLGAEPVDYPLTDGIVIYLKDKRGGKLALDLSTQEDGGLDVYLSRVRARQQGRGYFISKGGA